MKKKTGPKNTDVTIIGAGMAGLSLAALLAKEGISVTVIDREDPNVMATEKFDSRTIALSLGSRAILAPLKIWDRLEEAAEPIRSIDVQEGHDAFVLNFTAEETQDGAFGWILPNTRVRGVLYETAKKNGVRFIQGALKDIARDEDNVTVLLTDGSEIASSLLVGADGRASRVRDLLGFDTVNLDYRQTALVGLIAHEKPHHGLALERFYPDGPFAALPFTDAEDRHRSAIVWTRHAPRRLKVPPLSEITQEIAPMLDERYGKAEAVGLWAAYPLGLCHAKQFVQRRIALISDAAHGMHPIAGQGLNVGMRDVKVLSDLLIEAKKDDEDFGSWDLLESYQSSRRFDVMTMMAATDILNRLFANNIWPVRKLRSLGLGLVDRVKPLKKFFTHVATGT